MVIVTLLVAPSRPCPVPRHSPAIALRSVAGCAGGNEAQPRARAMTAPNASKRVQLVVRARFLIAILHELWVGRMSCFLYRIGSWQAPLRHWAEPTASRSHLP